MGSGLHAGKQVQVNYKENHRNWMDTCICFGQPAMNAYTPGTYPMANTNIFCENKLKPQAPQYLQDSIRIKKAMNSLECPSPVGK